MFSDRFFGIVLHLRVEGGCQNQPVFVQVVIGQVGAIVGVDDFYGILPDFFAEVRSQTGIVFDGFLLQFQFRVFVFFTGFFR